MVSLSSSPLCQHLSLLLLWLFQYEHVQTLDTRLHACLWRAVGVLDMDLHFCFALLRSPSSALDIWNGYEGPQSPVSGTHSFWDPLSNNLERGSVVSAPTSTNRVGQETVISDECVCPHQGVVQLIRMEGRKL